MPAVEIRARVLCVDDDVATLRLVADALFKVGIQVMPARSPADALRLLEAEKVDLILCDIMMPEKSGFTLVQELRRIPGAERIPVIFLSAATSDASIERAFAIGAVDFVRKPMSLADLRARVQARLGVRPAAHPDAHLEHAVRGDLALMSAPDLLTAMEVGTKTGVLTLRSDTLTGEIHFRQGRVVRVRAEGFASEEEAGYRLAVLTRGSFGLQYLPEAQVSGELDHSPQYFLLEALRRQDEAQRDRG